MQNALRMVCHHSGKKSCTQERQTRYYWRQSRVRALQQPNPNGESVTHIWLSTMPLRYPPFHKATSIRNTSSPPAMNGYQSSTSPMVTTWFHFQEMITITLEDMIGRELVNWMDDICIPGDNFDIKMKNLWKFFNRCRDKNLSLSPSKTKLFFTNALFAGTMIGLDSIKPNLDKVAAVVNWPQPQDVQDLTSFLGLTGYFWHLINDYTRIAAPFTDLIRKLDMDTPKKGWKVRKGAYKWALQSISLHNKWTSEHQKAFITPKVLLLQEPLLNSPQYDGRPFHVTTDSSLDGFAGWLSLKNSKWRTGTATTWSAGTLLHSAQNEPRPASHTTSRSY